MTLKEFGRRLAEREGIRPPGPGERRPDGYYMGDHYTGKCRVPRGAVERVERTVKETVAAILRGETA